MSHVDHHASVVAHRHVEPAGLSGRGHGGRLQGVEGQSEAPREVVARAQWDQPHDHPAQLAPVPQPLHGEVQAPVAAGDDEGPVVQAVQRTVQILVPSAAQQLGAPVSGEDAGHGLDLLAAP